MGIRSYFSHFSTTISSSIRETSDATQLPKRAPRPRREIAKAVSEVLERRLLFVAGPTAGSFVAAPVSITAASSTPEAISITYTDMTTPVLATSIARGNITVTGPGSVGVLAGGTAVASPTTDAATIVAGYTVTPPVGGWTAADDGPYNVVLNASVTDTSGNPVTPVMIGSFTVNIIASSGPTATLTAPTNITTAGGTTKNIVVTYTDSASPVDVTTIVPGNITVTGPGSTALTVMSATPSPLTNGSPITVTYVVTAPGGLAWSSADNGTYTIGLTSTVKDVATNAVTANASFGSFMVNIGTVGPVATLTVPTNITTAGGTTKSIVVTYTDSASPVDVTTIVPGNITVTGPGSTALTVMSATPSPLTNGSPITVTYVVTAPGGLAWSSADNGTYTIGLTSTVKDVATNAVTANASFGSFMVNIATVGPTATLTAPTNITTAGGTTKNIVVTYTDTTSPIDITTIGIGNITVTGPGSTALTILSATPSPATNGSPITVTYVVQAPGGTAWSTADDGTYTIGLTSTVKDVAANAVPANASFGSFSVAITPAPTAVFTPPVTIVANQQVFSFTVVYSDPTNPIKVSTIGINNVTVTGPGGPLQILSATPTPNADANSISVVYTVSAPTALGFRPADNGTYTVGLTATVTDTSGTPVVAAASFGTFIVNIVDVNAPIPTLIQDFDITSTGQFSKQVIISYTDSIGVDPTTITTSNITVTSSTGTALLVSSAVADSAIPKPIIQATYTIVKADGTVFTSLDNGTYTVSINPPPLSPANVSGIHVAALASIGTFTVAVPDRIGPTGVITAPDVTTTGVASETITVVLTDNTAVNVATIRATSLVVITPSGNRLPVARVIGINQANGPSITIQFVVNAPNGTFTSADNGVYTVTLTGVADTSGNLMTEAVGSFTVNVPAPVVRNFSLGSFSAAKGQTNKLKFRDTPDGTVGIVTIKEGSGQVIQEGLSNAIDLVLNDIGKGVSINLTTSNGRPVTINNIFVHGTLVDFNAPNANVTGTFYVNGTTQKATFRHLVGTPLLPAVFASSGPIEKLNITKATTQALVLSGANLGSTGLLNQPDDTFGSGQIKSLTLGGAFTTTVVAAGANPGADGTFGTGDDTSAGANSIVSTIFAGNGTGPTVKFEANGFGIFKFSKKKFTPNPGGDARFVILP